MVGDARNVLLATWVFSSGPLLPRGSQASNVAAMPKSMILRVLSRRESRSKKAVHSKPPNHSKPEDREHTQPKKMLLHLNPTRYF